MRSEVDPSIWGSALGFSLLGLPFDSQDGIILSESPLPILFRPQLIQANSGNKTFPGRWVHVYVDSVSPPW